MKGLSRYGTWKIVAHTSGYCLLTSYQWTLLMLTHYAHDLLTNVEYQESFQVSKVLEYLYIYQSSTSE